MREPLTLRFVLRSWWVMGPSWWHYWRVQQCEKAALRHWHQIAVKADRVRDLAVERGIL